MIIPGSNYWNIGVGLDKGDVEKDEEGIATMETLGENMAWLLTGLFMGQSVHLSYIARKLPGKSQKLTRQLCFRDGLDLTRETGSLPANDDSTAKRS